MTQQDQFARDLLAWYDANKRDLPWRRRQHDPYAVWVSEIMLQQTTVAAVIPFYHKWMARFPTVQSLAEAPLDDVLKHWAGLGYYARARNLHKGAQRVVAGYSGQVPSDPKTLPGLPGIGRYTAGAILSIAFNQDAPILDANVIRVLSRVHAVTGDPKTSAQTQAELWRLAEEAIPKGRAGDFNQALMELGALICEAGAPKCGSCPVSAECRARLLGDPTAYPQFEGVKKWLDVEDVSVALRNPARQVLLVQRSPELPLWGGLWELPRATRQDGETLELCAARAACESIGLDIQSAPPPQVWGAGGEGLGEEGAMNRAPTGASALFPAPQNWGGGVMHPFGVVKHVVANRRITLHGFEAAMSEDAAPEALGCVRWAWVTAETLNEYALATPQTKLAALLWLHAAQGRLEF